MPRLTDEQREQRRRKLQKDALESVAARGQFNFRLNGDDIKRLYSLAGGRRKPVGAMVREWVLDRLEAEEQNKTPAPVWAQALEQRLAHTEAYVLMALSSLISVEAQDREAIRSKLRDHVRQHVDIDRNEELRALLA